MTRTSGEIAKSLPQVGRLLWTLSEPYVKWRLGLALILTVLSAIIGAATPVALKYAIDGFAARPIDPSVVFLAIGLYVLGQWMARNLTELRVLFHGQAERRMYRSLSDRLFAHVMQLPLRFHLERQIGAISETLSNGLMGYQMVVQIAVYTLLPVLVQLAVVATVLFHFRQPIFLAMFLGAMVCYGIAFVYGTVRITRSAKAASESQIEARGVMMDALLNYETVKYFTAEPLVRERHDRAQGQTEHRWLLYYMTRTWNGLAIAAIFLAFLASAVIYAGYMTYRGQMSIGEFVLINTYVAQLIAPLEMMGYAMQSLSQGVAFLQKMLELFREKTESDPRAAAASPSAPQARSPPLALIEGELARRAQSTVPTVGEGKGSEDSPQRGELVFENVHVAYRSDRTVLRGVTFCVPRGRKVGIVGESGAGKSTIVRLLVRLLEADGGRILLDGVPITELSLPILRQAIAVVPQETVLFNDTIAYNIAFGRRGSTQKDVVAAARIAHLHEFVLGLPDGYQTRVGERGVKLSGGERQRVAIARAAIKQPRIYVFDEATSSLDSRTESEILANLQELSRGATTLAIAHRLSTIMDSDEIVVLEAGAIAEHGSHEELLRLGERYAGLWFAQTGVPSVVVPDAAAANEG